MGNILVSNKQFCDAVHREFLKLYAEADGRQHLEEVGEELLEIRSISTGLEELKVHSSLLFAQKNADVQQSRKHIFEQTPRFILSNESDEDAPVHLEFTIQGGQIGTGLDELSREHRKYFRNWLGRIVPDLN